MSQTALPRILLDALARDAATAILTGAGVSAESGIPTFREAQTGLWARFSPQDLATPEAYARDPQRVWDWYRWRRKLIANGGPNDAHRACAELQSRLSECRIITENVDGLHQAGGAGDVVELHGNLWRQRCAAGCGHLETSEDFADGPPPTCPTCGAALRPDVVWFGEALPEQALTAALAAMERAELVLVAGTSSMVYPAAGLPEAALQHGASVVEINPEPTPLSDRIHASLRGGAGTLLAAIAEQAPR